MRRLMLTYVGTVAIGTIAFLASPYTISRKVAVKTELNQTSHDVRETAWLAPLTHDEERQRIQSRLQLIDNLLRARDVSKWSPELQSARKKNLDILSAYWKKGEFPKNTDSKYRNVRMPYFIDKFGTPCAVGHLIIESGHRALAERIAKLDNNVYADQISDPEFFEWAKKSGLESEELTLIQPSYHTECIAGPDCPRCADLPSDPPGVISIRTTRCDSSSRPGTGPGPITEPPPHRQPATSGRRISLGRGVVCYDTSSTFLMRDTSSSCGWGTNFCTTPLRCYSSSTGQYLGGSIATCRAGTSTGGDISATASASGIGVGTGLLSCPDLQSCADDQAQEFISEKEGWKWQPADLSVQINSHSSSHALSEEH
jgi:hypothetical protein